MFARRSHLEGKPGRPVRKHVGLGLALPGQGRGRATPPQQVPETGRDTIRQ